MKIIVIAGMYRSGSTWMFNAVRLLAEETGLNIRASDYRSTLLNREVDVDVMIIKEHRYFQDLAEIADVVFTSYRDWGEAADSWERFRGERWTPGQIVDRREWLRRWNEHSVYCMPFEDLENDPDRAFPFTQERLPFPVSMEQSVVVNARLASLRPPEKGYDSETFMFHNHITSERLHNHV